MPGPIDLGDLNTHIATEGVAALKLITAASTMSLQRLDAMAQKSAFEVDSNEIGASAMGAIAGALQTGARVPDATSK